MCFSCLCYNKIIIFLIIIKLVYLYGWKTVWSISSFLTVYHGLFRFRNLFTGTSGREGLTYLATKCRQRQNHCSARVNSCKAHYFKYARQNCLCAIMTTSEVFPDTAQEKITQFDVHIWPCRLFFFSNNDKSTIIIGECIGYSLIQV